MTSLDDSTALSVATALVSSRLAYANSILFGCRLKCRSRLQRVQNALARITVPQNSSFPIRSTTALFRHLHWLPIDSRMYQFQTLYNKIKSAGLWSSSRLHILQVFSTTTALLEPCVPPPLNYLQFCAIFHSAHVLFAFLLPPLGTRSHRMSVIVHHLIVFGTTSKHTISVLPSPLSDT